MATPSSILAHSTFLQFVIVTLPCDSYLSAHCRMPSISWKVTEKLDKAARTLTKEPVCLPALFDCVCDTQLTPLEPLCLGLDRLVLCGLAWLHGLPCHLHQSCTSVTVQALLSEKKVEPHLSMLCAHVQSDLLRGTTLVLKYGNSPKLCKHLQPRRKKRMVSSRFRAVATKLETLADQAWQLREKGEAFVMASEQASAGGIPSFSGRGGSSKS